MLTCIIESFTVPNNDLLTSDGSVSSTRILGPVESGPNAQIERAASRSQSYLDWKNSPNFFLKYAQVNERCFYV